MTAAEALAPGLLSAGAVLAGFALLGRASPLARAFAAAVAAFLLLRYAVWRWSAPLPANGLAEAVWSRAFLLLESLSILSNLLVLFFMSRTLDRSPEADAGRDSPLQGAPVDVFVCTYNEGHEILERTILGATRIAHPDLRVWVLDDGARDWVRTLAADLGARYVRRVKGKHAKAGNINNGLRHALSTGRRPEFILLLDADFVPARHILRRALPLFAPSDVGIVQTPQHFFNADPMQRNLLASRTWPDEQRFFFNVLLPCKDAWGAAFCCGTSAVLRVSALEAAGGMATETVTEDMLTTFRMGEHGWRTVYLNERLSLGLAPEGLAEYVTQRSRWCLGALQQIYTRWSFLGRGRVSFMNRLSAFDASLYWSVSFLFRLSVLVGPLLYWWFSVSTLTATPLELLHVLAPAVAAQMIFMSVLAGNRVSPVLTDVSQLLSSVVVLRTVAHVAVKPFGHPFKVTPKGLSRDRVTVEWGLLLPFLLVGLATAGGMLANLGAWAPGRGDPGYALNMVWSLFNLVVIAVTVAACVEMPRPRQEERFAVNARARLRVPGSGAARGAGDAACTVLDMSVTGARLLFAGPVAPGDRLELRLPGSGLALPLEVVRARGGGEVSCRFLADKAARRELIALLYTGAFANDVAEVAPVRTLGLALRRVFG